MLVPKYVIALLTYSVVNLYPCSDLMAIQKRPAMRGPPKLATKLVTILNTAAPAISSSEGDTGQTVLSTANAWDSSRCVTDFLEGLKNWEADQEGTLCVPLLLQSP
jgi:hypothetical protein